MSKDPIGDKARRLMRDANAKGETLEWHDAIARAHEVHAKEVAEANEVRAKVLAAVKANPAILAPVLSRAPNVSAELQRDHARLMREGWSNHDAAIEATRIVQARADEWKASVMTLATVNGATVVPTAPAPRRAAARPAPKAETFVPSGMSAVDAVQAAASGRLPVRSALYQAGRQHMRLMRRVEELQAQGESYDAAFVAAATEMAAERSAAAKAGAK